LILCSQNQQFFFKDQRGLPNLIYRTPLNWFAAILLLLLLRFATVVTKTIKALHVSVITHSACLGFFAIELSFV
jgi:hypothetical protein